MTNAELIALAAARAAANAQAKRQIKAKRSRDAITIASAHTVRHAGKFPTRYKAG